MHLDIVSYHDLVAFNPQALKQLEMALLNKGIVGISHVPEFEMKSRNYINAARDFSALQEKIKQQYTPDRDAGNTEGYELGAEKFKDQNGNWQIDDKKASYYAYVPEKPCNVWPREVDLQTPYVELGEFGQLISDDRIRATRHTVKKVKSGIERFTFALFYSANDATVVKSTSLLIADTRYADNQSPDGSITAAKWQEASYARYRAK
jgi:isopenicillin N synthase-like dioxygenase